MILADFCGPAWRFECERSESVWRVSPHFRLKRLRLRSESGHSTSVVAFVCGDRHEATTEKLERLWELYWKITEQHGNGYATPILWHLVLRGHAGAMTVLSSKFDYEGRVAEAFSQAGLAYRAFRRGDPIGANHLAMNAFNSGDLTRYRYWLARGARAGDECLACAPAVRDTTAS